MAKCKKSCSGDPSPWFGQRSFGNPSTRPRRTGDHNGDQVTGFQEDFGWVRLPGVLDAQGQPLHEGGFACVPGVHFAGLPFAIPRRSGTMPAIAEEAAMLAGDIRRRVDASL